MNLPFQLSSHRENPCQGFISLWRSPQRMDFKQHIYILSHAQSKKRDWIKAITELDCLLIFWCLVFCDIDVDAQGTSPVMELKELHQSEWYWSQESSVLEYLFEQVALPHWIILYLMFWHLSKYLSSWKFNNEHRLNRFFGTISCSRMLNKANQTSDLQSIISGPLVSGKLPWKWK